MDNFDEETRLFLEEREKKLGGKLIYRSYATWFAEINGERREYGVFLYSDGTTLVVEDFFRPTTFLGYRVGTKNEKEREKNYTKMEIFLPIKEITCTEYCSRHSAEKSLKTLNDVSKRATLFNKIFTKTCTKVKCKDRVFFFELPSFKEFINLVNKKGELI